jgi:hypothetical protein
MNGNKDKFDQIRSLLDDVERDLPANDQTIFAQNFDALELPSVVSAIVDFLQPLLHPYEAAIYWYLFRNSMLSVGQQYLRASTKSMRQGVIRSSSGQSEALSYISRTAGTCRT